MPDPPPDLVPVFRTADSNLLPIVKSVLEAAQIPFLVQGEGALGLLPMGPFAVGINRRSLGAIVHVPEDRAEEAIALLRSCEPTD